MAKKKRGAVTRQTVASWKAAINAALADVRKAEGALRKLQRRIAIVAGKRF
jgi:hypothetical protein